MLDMFPLVTKRMLTVVGLAFCTMLGTAKGAVARPIFVIRRPDGSVTFTTKKPQGSGKVTIYTGEKASFSRSPFDRVRTARPSLRVHAFRELIDSISKDHGVDSALVKAMVHVESSFNPDARSPKGAQGLMQLMPATAERFGVVNPFDPKENIHGGVRYMALLIRQFGGDLRQALAAYNAGENAVKRYGGIPPFAETRHYVSKVLSLVPRYREIGKLD
jgi:soluble lytic murein transglycosylase-like protein